MILEITEDNKKKKEMGNQCKLWTFISAIHWETVITSHVWCILRKNVFLSIEKKTIHVSALQNCELSSIHILVKWEMTFVKISSLQGIVNPPIGWWNPYSSSAWTSKSWNKDSLRYDIGIKNLFFSSSPTYTATYPFGTSVVVDAMAFCSVNDDRLRYCFAWIIRGILIAMVKQRIVLWAE